MWRRLTLNHGLGPLQIVERGRIVGLQLNRDAKFSDGISQAAGFSEHDAETHVGSGKGRRNLDATPKDRLRLVELSNGGEGIRLIEQVSRRTRIRRNRGCERVQGTLGLLHLDQYDPEVG